MSLLAINLLYGLTVHALLWIVDLLGAYSCTSSLAKFLKLLLGFDLAVSDKF